MSKYQGLQKAHSAIDHVVLAMDNLADAISTGHVLYESATLPAAHQRQLLSDLKKAHSALANIDKAFYQMKPLTGWTRK